MTPDELEILLRKEYAKSLLQDYNDETTKGIDEIYKYSTDSKPDSLNYDNVTKPSELILLLTTDEVKHLFPNQSAPLIFNQFALPCKGL